MARIKIKWTFVLFYLLIFNVLTKSLPIGILPTTTDTIYTSDIPSDIPVTENVEQSTINIEEVETNDTNIALAQNITRNTLLRNLRPGQTVSQYFVEITIDGDSFEGRVVMSVQITAEMREDPLVFHVEDLNIISAAVGVVTDVNPADAEIWLDDGILEVTPQRQATSYRVIIDYSGDLGTTGEGLYMGRYGDNTYIGMNLSPTNARRVFPCMDDPVEENLIAFKFNNINYNQFVGNTMLEEGTTDEFRVIQGPPHRWGMIAHNFDSINQPTAGVTLFGRSGFSQQEAVASAAINFFVNNLNEWTDKDFFEIDINQDGRMVIVALPDVTHEWNSLSIVGIWEPYVLMQQASHSVKQRSTAFVKIGEAIARQWYGYVVYPRNWRYEWVTRGFSSYAAWEMLEMFQENNFNDISLLDVNTLFVTEVIQESLLRDAYITSQQLEPDDDLLDEDPIREFVNGVVKYKAPAIMKMLSTILADGDTDLIQVAARGVLNDALVSMTSHSFFDAVNSQFDGNQYIEDLEEYMEQWLKNTGYPIVHVGSRQGGAFLTQERFSFSPVSQETYEVPITFTTSLERDFDNLQPRLLMGSTELVDFTLGDEEWDWVVFNLQGQGYYRVNYDFELWDRIIEALSDPELREEIHPLNRATLVDDALNLARANRLPYEVAFRVVLTMEHEMEYAVWKAFVRNMEFLRKRLVALIEDDEDLDPDIYLRMVRRTIHMVEDEIGFYPDPQVSEPAMTSLTRGLVMEHACKANYAPCIAAAVDWFFDGNSDEPTVNPDIPHDIRPAVYCTMMKEGGGDVIEALMNRLEIEPTQYERVVILEALGCSSDGSYINGLLEDTINPDTPYTTEERLRIYKAVAESSLDNAFNALNFASMRTIEIRDMYGGPRALEEALFTLAENMADFGSSADFRNWVMNMNNNLWGSQDFASNVNDYVEENVRWGDLFLDDIYEWIDENDATTAATSMLLLFITVLMTFFNH